MRNRFGERLENGYAPSIIQDITETCYLCNRSDQKLDRHEPFNGPFRKKSKELGMWVVLCHERCHLGKAHKKFQTAKELKQAAQTAAMKAYGWDVKEFVREFGKNWL